MNVLSRLVGMIRSPRKTLRAAIERPRSFDLAVTILLISAACSAGFLMTTVGRLAALDQALRQLESIGVVVTDERYADLRGWLPYRPALSAAAILVGWPVMWTVMAVVVRAIGNRASQATAGFAQVFTVLVHASAVLALRELVAVPLNYARESLGGATSIALLLPGFGESTFAARLLGAIDIFVLWWGVLVALGLSILYQRRTMTFARWLVGAYAAGAVLLALTQVLRGGG